MVQKEAEDLVFRWPGRFLWIPQCFGEANRQIPLLARSTGGIEAGFRRLGAKNHCIMVARRQEEGAVVYFLGCCPDPAADHCVWAGTVYNRSCAGMCCGKGAKRLNRERGCDHSEPIKIQLGSKKTPIQRHLRGIHVIPRNSARWHNLFGAHCIYKRIAKTIPGLTFSSCYTQPLYLRVV